MSIRRRVAVLALLFVGALAAAAAGPALQSADSQDADLFKCEVGCTVLT